MHASRVGRYKIDLEYGDDEAGGASSIFSMSTMELDPSVSLDHIAPLTSARHRTRTLTRTRTIAHAYT
jgi:hypothetical protein